MLNKFMQFAEATTLAELMPDFSYKNQRMLSHFLRTQYLFFAIVSIVSCAIMPLKLLVSVWKEVNKRGN
jgi:hypothetical protein